MQEMSASSEQIEHLIQEAISGHSCWQRLAEESADIAAAVRAVLLTPGKRLRPRLFLLAAEGYGLQPLPTLAPVALSLELAHTFVLVHDDLIDRSQARRGEPTLATRLDTLFNERPPRAFTGDDTALVAGDLLYTLALDTLLQAAAPERARLEAVRCFTNAALITARGALREIELARLPPNQVSHDVLLHAYRLKTACYTFALPLQLAAVFAGRHQALAMPITTFADAAGVAFQLMNDLAALEPWIQGGPVPDDIRDHRLTPALRYAWQQTEVRDRDKLMAGDTAIVRQIFIATGTLGWLRARIHEHTTQARHAVAALELTEKNSNQICQMLCPLSP